VAGRLIKRRSILEFLSPEPPVYARASPRWNRQSALELFIAAFATESPPK
jgi:hypothetical protein